MTQLKPSPPSPRPLQGLRVLELGQLLAGPFAGCLLGYFGADVIKVESLSGDPLRGWRELEDGTSLWWRSLSRNKRCIALDLHREEGRAIVRELLLTTDVLLENFRPGTMEAWGLGPEVVTELAPRVVYARVSGFGQTGPDRERPGFASVCEAVAGLRYITGHPGELPVRPNLSLGDSLGGLHAMLGVLLALRARDLTGRGQVVDIALTESIFHVLEATLIEADRGVTRQPSGVTITGVVPSSAYRCSAEGGRSEPIVIGANTDKLFDKLMRLIERADLAADPALTSNPGRVARAQEIDLAIEAWTSARSAEEAVAALAVAGIPAGRIQNAAQVLEDPQVRARGTMETVAYKDADLRLPKLAPLLSETPGRTDFVGPEIGAHTREVLLELGRTEAQLAKLLADRVAR